MKGFSVKATTAKDLILCRHYGTDYKCLTSPMLFIVPVGLWNWKKPSATEKPVRFFSVVAVPLELSLVYNWFYLPWFSLKTFPLNLAHELWLSLRIDISELKTFHYSICQNAAFVLTGLMVTSNHEKLERLSMKIFYFLIIQASVCNSNLTFCTSFQCKLEC